MKESEPSQAVAFWFNRFSQYCMTSYSDSMVTGWFWEPPAAVRGWTQTKPFCSPRLITEKCPQACWSLKPLFKHHPCNVFWRFAGQLVCQGGQKARLRFLFRAQVWADTQAALICLSPRMGCNTSPAAPHFLRESLKSDMDPLGQSDPQSCCLLGFTADMHVSWRSDGHLNSRKPALH